MRSRKFLLLVLLILCVAWFARVRFFKEADANIGVPLQVKDMSDSLTEQVRSFSLSGFSETGKKLWQVEGKSADILIQ